MASSETTNAGLSHLLLIPALLAILLASVNAQEGYPNRAIKMVVPIPPGVTANLFPRIVAEKLTTRWGQPVIIENRPGAGLTLGAEMVAKAPPDGYTLLATPAGPLVVTQSFFPKLRYDPSAFVPVLNLRHAAVSSGRRPEGTGIDVAGVHCLRESQSR